jgi:hypothetical protein
LALTVDGAEVARARGTGDYPPPSPPAIPSTLASTSGSPVSLEYFNRRPFQFDGKIESVHVELK